MFRSRNLRNINTPVLVRVMGRLLLIEACFMLVPLAASFIWGGGRDAEAFMISIAVAAAAGIPAGYMLKPKSRDMYRREGYLLTALVWVVFSAFGMLPFMLSSTPLPLSEAFFEAMSGFTTTGASVLPSVSHLSHAILLWRCLMQWIGGMGIILFTLAVLPSLNHSGGMQMFNAEVTGITHDKLRPRISQTAKGLWGTYLLLSLALFVLLWFGPMNTFESLCHAMSTMSTGGFSTLDASVTGWNSVYVMAVVTVFMFLGGVNFVLIFRVASGQGFKLLWKNDVFRNYVIIIAGCWILFDAAILLDGAYTGVESLTIDPLFQVVSTITSTGYVAGGFYNWGPFVLAATLVLMFSGACAGSTSGGAKIDRLLILFKTCRNEIRRVLHPNEVLSVRANNRVVPPHIVTKVIAFLSIYLLLIVAGGIVLSTLGIPLVDAFFSSFSCICNTGLSAGVTGYGANFDILPPAGLWFLSLLMLIGRLELFTVLILFTRDFWQR